MPTLPASTDITSSTTTEGNLKAWLSAVRTYIASLLGNGGAQGEALTALGAPFNSTLPKTGAYTVVAADRGKVISCTNTFTLALSAASTLGDGFSVTVVNAGTGTITVDPNLSELIDGQTTKTIGAGNSTVIICDGTQFRMVGLGSVRTVNSVAPDAAGNVSITIPTNFVPTDAGFDGIGSFAFVRKNSNTGAGGVVAGSELFSISIVDDGLGTPLKNPGAAPYSFSGSWRVMNSNASGYGFCYCIAQRIA